MELLADFRQFIRENRLIGSNSKLLIAISGGVDSIALCHLLNQCEYDVCWAHCNFQLRDEASDKDQALVELLSTRWDIKLHTRRFETDRIAKEQVISIQMAARKLRYDWFEELCNAHNYTHIVTAHHQDDQAESVILNLTRGTGLKGLQGIPIKRDKIIRPLLFASKQRILDYANEQGLKWREDQSNRELKYHRNFVRQEIIPRLERINPGINESLSRTANYLSQIGEVFEEEMKKIEIESLEKTEEDVVIDLNAIQPPNRTTAFVSFQLLIYNFNQHQIDQILKNLTETGLMFYSNSHQLNIDRGKLWISSNKPETEYYEYENRDSFLETRYQKLVFNEVNRNEYSIRDNQEIAALNLSALKYPLVIRSWQSGDYFTPLGMSGKKKLSDFMIDRKIPLNLKERQLVLSSGHEIAWVIGRQISDKFKITDDTSKVLEITMIPKDA